jgi:Mg-chelatase subunit ChlD
MRSLIIALFIAIIVSSIFIPGTAAQSGRRTQKDSISKPAAQSEPQPKSADAESKREDSQDADAVKLGTTLVTVPVIASDHNGIYITDLKKEDFTLNEDGIKQEIVFFATIKEPFHVVLMLDTSASAQEQLGEIQRAAIAFVEQLQPADRVKVISFDDEVRDLIAFTADRAALSTAIRSTRPGKGTKLYDAVRIALGSLRPIQGRKAIVLFTDGVDWHSDSTGYEDNIRAVEESGVIVYPVRYDTRAETEALLRRQEQGGQTPDLGVILGGPPIGTTPPTTSGGDNPIPRTGGQKNPLELPLPPVINPPRTGRYPDNRYPDDRFPGGRNPTGRYPDDQYPDNRYPDNRSPDRRYPDNRRGQRDDSTSVMLDGLYKIADSYLNDLANRSGGKLHRADTLVSLPAAFAQIAAELRTQYSLGYYPANPARDDKYRKIQVRVNRKNVVIRARPGYRASTGV